MTKKVGHLVRAIDFSDAEKNRIADSLRGCVGYPYEMFIKYALQIKENDFWNTAQRRFKVTGFRDGHPTAKQMVVRRALDTLKNSTGSENNQIWPIYRMSVYTSMSEELENLEKMLLQEEIDASIKLGTEEIFKALKQKMPLYGYTNEDLLKFYEIWGFDRIDNLSTILDDRTLDLEVVKRLMGTEFDKLKKTFTAELEEITVPIQKKVSELDKKLSKLVSDAETIDDRFSYSISVLRTEFQNLAADLFTKKVSELQLNLKKSIEKSAPSIKPSFDTEALFSIENKIDKLSKRIQIIDNKMVQEESDRYAAKVKVQPSVQNNESVLDIFRSWTAQCKGYGVSHNTLQLLPLLFQTITRTKIIISYQPQPLVDLFKLARCQFKNTCVSPMWTSKKDMEAEFKFLTDASSASKVLVVSDFDVALQELYLIPFLIEWMNDEASNFNKIILVPSTSSLNRINTRVLELGWIFEWKDDLQKSIAINVDDCLEKFEKSNFAAQNSFELFRYQSSNNILFQSDLAKISLNEGVLLPPALMTQFMNIQIGLKSILSEGDSGKAAISFCIIPWLKRSRGDAICRIFEERFRIVFGGI